MTASQALIIFVRNPDHGKVKTRLATSIGKDESLEVYKKLLQHTFLQTKSLNVNKFVFYVDQIGTDDIWAEGSYQKNVQQGIDLGDRMYQAVKSVSESCAGSTILIGSDCPEIDEDLLKRAFNILDTRDLVIGPATDGGYYLIGMNDPYFELFKNISWSSPAVLSETLQKARELHLDLELLKELSDIDTEEDLRKARNQGIDWL